RNRIYCRKESTPHTQSGDDVSTGRDDTSLFTPAAHVALIAESDDIHDPQDAPGVPPGPRIPMIGVVSNSDGRAEALAAAMELFVASGVEFVVHCGDIGGRHVLDVLSRLQSGFVWGDRDSDRM